VEGKGGGKATLAEAGGKNVAGLDLALERAEAAIRELLAGQGQA
jgi:hypothetical protein